MDLHEAGLEWIIHLESVCDTESLRDDGRNKEWEREAKEKIESWEESVVDGNNCEFLKRKNIV